MKKGLDELRISCNNIFLKLNVQAYELHALRGCDSLLQKTNGALIEVNTANLYAGQADFQSIISIFELHGQAFKGDIDQIFDSNGELPYFDAILIRQQ